MSWQAPRTTTQTRLPWWAVVLPALAFALLLALVVAPGSAGAQGAEPGTELLDRVLRALPDLVRHVL